MTFYKDCLGGGLNLMAVGDSPIPAQMPADAKNKIMHSQLNVGDSIIMASDMVMGTSGVTAGNRYSLSVNCSSKKEADAIYGKLSAGGKAVHPMKDEFFGYYGELTDKFGVAWMVSYAPGQQS